MSQGVAHSPGSRPLVGTSSDALFDLRLEVRLDVRRDVRKRASLVVVGALTLKELRAPQRRQTAELRLSALFLMWCWWWLLLSCGCQSWLASSRLGLGLGVSLSFAATFRPLCKRRAP